MNCLLTLENIRIGRAVIRSLRDGRAWAYDVDPAFPKGECVVRPGEELTLRTAGRWAPCFVLTGIKGERIIPLVRVGRR